LGIASTHRSQWGIGAEILIRREQAKVSEVSTTSARRNSDNDTSLVHNDENNAPTKTKFADEGFKLAREYYERLVLQYPYTPHTQHTVNAKVFYPALFNIWVYEVQARYKHLRTESSKARRSSSHSIASDSDSELNGSQQALLSRDLLAREIADTTAIVDRLDQLLLSPPYDISEPLLKTRGMIGLWLSDMYKSLANSNSRQSGEFSSSPPAVRDDYADRVTVAQNRQKASKERRRARELLAKVAGQDASAGVALRAADAEDMSE
jgi:hypothetical protein